MDSLVTWELGGGSDELLTALGRMTLLFTAVDECVTAAIHGYIEANPSLGSVLGDTKPEDLSGKGFSQKHEWLKDILGQMDHKLEGHSDVLGVVREAGSLNADRREYTHGLVRLSDGELVFQNKGRALRAADIDDLNSRLTEWLGRFWGKYILHCMYADAKN
jgi:hypothetical protein